MMGTSTQFANGLIGDQISLIDKVVTYNAIYLGISVSAVLAVTAIIASLIYLFGFKPLEEKIKQQNADLKKFVEESKKNEQLAREKISQLKKDANKRIIKLEKSLENNTIKSSEKIRAQEECIALLNNDLAESTEKVKKDFTHLEQDLTKRFKEKATALENQIIKVQAAMHWSNHYLWEQYKIPENVLSSLLSCIQTANKTSSARHFVELSLRTIMDSLSGNSGLVFSKNLLRSQWYDGAGTFEESIVSILDKLNGFEKEKASIKSHLKKILEAE